MPEFHCLRMSVEDEDEEEDEMADKGGDEFGCGQLLMPFEQLLQNTGSQTTFNRQMVGRILLEYFKSAVDTNSELNVDEVFNTVHQIVSDPEPSIRLDLVEQLPHVVIMCQETPHLFGDVVSRYILGIILKYLRDSDNQVRQTAQAALIAIVERGILSKKQLEYEICPVILKMTYMQIEFLNTAIVLISKLGPYMGSELLERVLLDRYLVLCEDDKFFVRKVCASYLGEICAAITKTVVYKKLLPKYINLCMDEIWGVRKACVDVMLSVASCVTIHEYRLVLSKLLATQLNDESKWVRTSAYQILGPFISIFARQFSGLRYNQFGDFVMSHSQGSTLRQNIVPSTKNESVVGPNDIFATPLEREIGVLGIDMYVSNKGKVPSNGKKKNDSMYFPISNWLGEIAESEEQTDGSGEASGDDVNKFNPFQYYYIPPEMPLDLELVQPCDKTSSEDVGGEGFEEVFDDVFSEALSEKTAQVLPGGSWQQQTESPPQSVADNVVSNRKPSTTSSSLEKPKAEQSDGAIREENLESDVSKLYSNFVIGLYTTPIKPPKISNLIRETAENVEISNIEQVETESTKKSHQDFEEEPMHESGDKADNSECDNKTCDVQPKSESLNDACDVSNLSRDVETGEYNTPPTSASNKTCDARPKSESLNDTVDVSNLSRDFEEYNTPPIRVSSEESAGEIVPQFLIDYFVSMVDPSPLTDIGTEIHHQCAFYFPAVVMTLGRKNWHQLKNAYQALASAVQWKVRCTLASSIHEIALILGEELSGSDLVPIYDGFIKDLDEVRIGALKHLNTFLRVLRPADRQQYLPKLSDFVVTDNEWNWRFREEFAGQLVKLVVLYKPEDVSEHIAPLALQLLQDKVAAVRQIAVSLITVITTYLRDEKALVTALIQELRDLLSLNKWTCRQTYALVCSQLVRDTAIDRDVFGKEMMPCLLRLSEDKVPNVRLAVARCLSTDIIPVSQWFEAELMETIVKKLKKLHCDPDRDVRVLAGGREIIEPGDCHTFLLDAF
ncbi:serine/threonine-protein phosphatase 4 regulatory subunit 1-like isoform X2 [Belonocnema kinseyi]|uniref:serine/threonine-protein phosphatase 4 regulatory subunit 1-like isoform X2 n=1 Tax=Belonocnema kinseyi TaxID=2817044 RepID=UPI00143D2B1A|nr:serine/threonine-protein phosphatase 4 regulatory subunit 1-like isoform X2 [Belonocnema kinseyi]